MERIDDFLTVGEAAAILRVSVGTVRRWAREDRLPTFWTPGHQRRFRRADVLALLRPKEEAC